MLAGPALLALNHLLAGASWARQMLQPFAGLGARLAIAPWQVEFVVTADGLLSLPAKGANEPDVIITLPPDTPLRRLIDPESGLRGAHISGAADFADALGFVLSHLNWDFEEDMTHVFGDIVGRRLATSMSTLLNWQRLAARNLAENFAEYLSHEADVLSRTDQLHEFKIGVDTLSDGLSRLDMRLRRLTGS